MAAVPAEPPAAAPAPLPRPPSNPAGVTLFRYIATKCLLFDDPYAAVVCSRYNSRFIHLMLALFLTLGRWIPVVWGFCLRQYERITPGLLGWVVARGWWLDRIFADADVQQVVVLSAGFDFRPYRLPAPGGAKVFEVDLPGVQMQKQSVLKSLGARTAAAMARVGFAQADPEAGAAALRAGLTAADFVFSKRTLFIIESALNTMSREAVETTLGLIGGCAAPGSTVALAFMTDESADVAAPGYGTAAARQNRGAYAYFFPPGGERTRPWLEEALGRRAAVSQLLRSQDLENKFLSRLKPWPTWIMGKFRCLAHCSVALVELKRAEDS